MIVDVERKSVSRGQRKANVSAIKCLQEDNTIDVLSPSAPETDHELFFGPILAEPFRSDATSTADLLVELGLAQSKSWCRKNGWDKPIEPGFNVFVFGSKRVSIYVLRRWE
jgi:hypothetical protein